MHAYNQAVVSRDMTRAELERIETEIQQVQHDYEKLNSAPMATAAPLQTTEQERNRLAKKLALLTEERTRWLTAYANAEQAIQRELERRVHEWHGERVHQAHMLEEATTPEDIHEARRRRDEAQTHIDQHEQELTKMRDRAQETQE